MPRESQQIAKAITIDPQGDVKLILDNGTLLVSRAALCRNSSVFRAMLNENSKFWEASDNAIGQDQLRSIPLREDNFDAMEVVMRVMHQQNFKVWTKVSFVELNTLAVICDKYDLSECLTPWSLVWLPQYYFCLETGGHERWLFISIVFRDEIAFTRVTRRLILETHIIPNKLTVGRLADIEEGVPDGHIRKPLLGVLRSLYSLLTGLVGQIKEERARVYGLIEERLRHYMLGLRDNNEEHCKVISERRLCNAFNLGTLLQRCPWMVDPKAQDDIGKPITWIITAIGELSCYYGRNMKWTPREEENRTHEHCALSETLYPELKEIADRTQGLALKPLVSKE